MWGLSRVKLTDVGGHLFRADFRKVPRHDPVVESVEHADQPRVHPRRGLHVEDEVEAHEGRHHGEVAKYSGAVAHFVYQQEPLVHQSRGCSLLQVKSGICLSFHRRTDMQCQGSGVLGVFMIVY